VFALAWLLFGYLLLSGSVHLAHPCAAPACPLCCYFLPTLSNLLLKIEFAGATYYSCGSSGLGTLDASSAAGPSAAPCHSVPDLQAALQLPTNPNESPALEVGVLFGMLVLLRLMVYYTLRQKTKAA
jgi:hypothetical protein